VRCPAVAKGPPRASRLRRPRWRCSAAAQQQAVAAAVLAVVLAAARRAVVLAVVLVAVRAAQRAVVRAASWLVEGRDGLCSHGWLSRWATLRRVRRQRGRAAQWRPSLLRVLQRLAQRVHQSRVREVQRLRTEVRRDCRRHRRARMARLWRTVVRRWTVS
jgi:hypothetical protein